MRNANNSNIFAGDRNYKTNFFLQFFSKQTEKKFREENFRRNCYSLQGFLVFSICYHAINFMQSDCFHFASSCNHRTLLIFTMITLITALYCAQKKFSSLYFHILLLPTTIYQCQLFLEKYSLDASLIMMAICTSITGFLVHSVWFIQASYNVCAYGLFFLYTRLESVHYWLRKPESEIFLDLALYNFIAIIALAFLEKGHKEKWVLLDTFKKSERIFRQLYEEIPYPVFIIEKNKKVLYSNNQGISLVSNYEKGYKSCNLSKRNLYLDQIVDQNSYNLMDNLLAEVLASKHAASDYLNLNVPKEQLPEGAIHVVAKDNHYKMTINPVVWKKSFVYMVSLVDYTTKRRAESACTKSSEGLIKEVQGLMKKCEGYAPENFDQRFKLDLIAQVNSLKLSILNTKMLIHQVFEKKDKLKLKEEVNFNIRKTVLASVATLSPTLKQRLCDLQLRFEPSFPQSVYADELLFEQIFFNTLSIFIKKLTKTKISIDCKLSSLRSDGKYLLAIDFEIPKNNELGYNPLQASLDATRVSRIDHFIEDDQILYGLALIRPGVELLGGTSELEEGQNVVCLTIQLPMQSHDNSKQMAHSPFTTFESADYDSSSKPSLQTYYWDHARSGRPSILVDSQEQRDTIASLSAGNTTTFPRNTLLLEEPKKGHSRASSMDRSPGRSSFVDASYKNKFIEELNKIKTENDKNFGSVSQAQQQINSEAADVSTSNTHVAPYVKQRSNDSNSSMNVEERKDMEPRDVIREWMKKQAPKIILNKAEEMKALSCEDLSDRESVQSFLRQYQNHEQQMKLALAKGLLALLDDHRFKVSNKQEEMGSTLEVVTLSKRMKGQWINETKLYKKTVEYLSTKLEDDQFRIKFMTFLEQDVENLRRELEVYQDSTLGSSVQNKSFVSTAEVVIEDSPIPVMRRAVTSNVRELISFKRRTSVSERSQVMSLDTERSKERSLNERFLLSPSVSQTVVKIARKSIFERMARDTDRDSSDIPSISEERKIDKIELENKIQEKKRSEQLKKELVPFTSEKIPVALVLRSHRHKRRWESIGTSINTGAGTSTKQFRYNDNFTILVADDSNFVLKAVTALPIKYKVKMEFASNGSEAVKKYLGNIEQGIMFHLILMDLQMPVMDGFEATRNIREEERNKQYPQTYICAMSAFEEAEAAARAKRDGINNYCQKPLRVEVLHSLIKTRCEEIGIPLPE